MAYVHGAGGVSLHYRDWSAGRNVVLVHGDNVDSSYWQYQIAVLGMNGCRVVAPDRRGHGLSDYVSTGYELNIYADDLASVLTDVDLNDVILIGHSTGASTIVRYLSRFGSDRVAAIVLAGLATVRTIAPHDGASREFLQQTIDATLDDRAAFFHSLEESFFGPGLSKAMMHSFIERCLDLPLEIALEEGRFRLNERNDVRDDFPKIALPTLILHGDSDTFAPFETSGRIAHDSIAGSKLILYEDASHGFTIAQQGRVTGDILAFIDSEIEIGDYGKQSASLTA